MDGPNWCFCMVRFGCRLLSFFVVAVTSILLFPGFAHATAPAVVTKVVPTTTTGQVVLTWTNPASLDFTGTMVRYSTTAFPTSSSDGTLASDVAGAVSGTSTLTVSSLTNNTTYYFSLFSHNVTPEYGTAVNAQQYVMAAQFTEDFESDAVAAVSGQNGWATVSGTWNVIDTAGEQTLQSGADNQGFHLYRALNGGSAAAYSDQMIRVDWKGSTTSTPGQVFLRAGSATADAGGYFMWQTGSQIRIAYKTTTGSTQATLASASFSISADTWYTYEFSAINNSLGQTVLNGYVWARGNAKPSTPNVTYTDTFNRFAQGVFSVGKTSTTVVEYDNITYYGRIGDSLATATPADGSVVLAWTNPTYATYTGTMVRYSTSAYPTSTTDGTLLASTTGSSGGTSTVTHSSLTNGTLYYYTLFPYDNAAVYGTPLYLRQVAYPSLFTDPFTSSNVATISGQNGWTIAGGTWAAADISSDRAVSGTAATPDFYTNKITNGSAHTANQILKARYQASAASNNAGQYWLRQQSDADAGYVFWHNGDTWTLSITTAAATIADVATSTAAPPQEASVWYNVEVSAIDNGSNQAVLNLFVWKTGTERPAVPQIAYTDTSATYSLGAFSLGKSNSAETGSFDDVAFYGSTPVVSITTPAAAVSGATDVATLAIVDGGGTIYIPYIQTSTTLSVAATAGAVPAGGGVAFVLNEGLASQQTSIDTSSPYTASFTSLAKAEYTIDAYTVQADGTTHYSGTDSHDERTDVGIGDIITLIGDSVTEGVSGTLDAGTVSSWLDGDAGTVSADNRQFPQHGAFGDTYKESFLTDLNDKLATYYGYPVFFMNEGVAGLKSSNYVSSAIDAAWTSRQNALAPNGWVITLGANDANTAVSAADYQTNITALISTLTTTYGATASQIYLNYPNYDGRTGSGGANSTYELLYLPVIDTMRSTLGLQGGADWYYPTSIHFSGEYTGTVHPNATGYVRIARLQGLAFMKPVLSTATVAGRNVSLAWNNLASSESTVAGYRINYGTSATSLTSSTTTTSTSTTLFALNPARDYYFSVEAYDSDTSATSYSDDSATTSALRTASSSSTTALGTGVGGGSGPRSSEPDFPQISPTLPSNTVSNEVPSDTESGSGVVVPAGSGVSPVTGLAESVSSVTAGQYIRSPDFSTVYFVDDNGVRHPFMDAQTFATYDVDPTLVTTVTNATLPELPLGVPMLPKAGTVLVKIVSDPRVYVVEANADDAFRPTLRWIPSEATAIALYGSAWASSVIDVDVGLFGRFGVGNAVTEALIVGSTPLKLREELL